MTNILQKVVLTLAQYFIIIAFTKLFRIQLSAPVFILIIVSGCLVWLLTTLCNLLLIRAIKRKQRILFRLLLLLKANVSASDRQWKTPLHHAVDAHDEHILMALLRKPKARINCLDRKGVSPVMQALADPQLSLRIKEAFVNHPDFNIFFTGLNRSVPALPSLLLEMRTGNCSQGDRQLEILLRMKLRAAMEYLQGSHEYLREGNNEDGRSRSLSHSNSNSIQTQTQEQTGTLQRIDDEVFK